MSKLNKDQKIQLSLAAAAAAVFVIVPPLAHDKPAATTRLQEAGYTDIQLRTTPNPFEHAFNCNLDVNVTRFEATSRDGKKAAGYFCNTPVLNQRGYLVIKS